MATSLQRYVTQRQAQRARPAPPPAPVRRTTTAQAIVPTSRAPARNSMAPPVRQPAVDTMAPPVPRPIQQPVTAPPTGMAQQAPVTAPGQSAPPPAQGQQAPPPPPSLFKEPIAAEFAAPPPNPLLGGMSPGDALGGGLTMQQPDGTRQGQTAQMPPEKINYPGQNFGPSDLSLPGPQQQQQSPQMYQLLSIMPAEVRAQVTPEQLAALTPDQIAKAIADFSRPPTPNIASHGDFHINPRRSAPGPVAPQMSDLTGQGQVYGLGRSNPLSM